MSANVPVSSTEWTALNTAAQSNVIVTNGSHLAVALAIAANATEAAAGAAHPLPGGATWPLANLGGKLVYAKALTTQTGTLPLTVSAY